jgi:hypothetical protein
VFGLLGVASDEKYDEHILTGLWELYERSASRTTLSQLRLLQCRQHACYEAVDIDFAFFAFDLSERTNERQTQSSSH